MLDIISEVVLLLTNTDCRHQVEDYVRGCSTSTKYWQPSTSWLLCQRLFYFYQILTTFTKFKIMSEVVLPSNKYNQIITTFTKLKFMSEIVLLLPTTNHLHQWEYYVRGCSTSTKYWSPSSRWILCQRLYYFYQILITFIKLTIMPETVILLPNTDCLNQV